MRVEQRRQARRDALDERRRALLPELDLLPVPHHDVGVVGDDLAEHVRVAAHELVVDAAGHVGHGERADLLGQDRVEHDLVEQVTELVDQARRTPPGATASSPPGAPVGSASMASTTS